MLRREHSGFVVREAALVAGAVAVRIEPRADFPVFPTAACELRVNFMDGDNWPLDTKSVRLRTDGPMKIAAPNGTRLFRIEIWRGAFRTASFGYVRPN